MVGKLGPHGLLRGLATSWVVFNSSCLTLCLKPAGMPRCMILSMSSVASSQRFLKFLEACPVKRKTKVTVEVAHLLMFWSLRWLPQVLQQHGKLVRLFGFTCSFDLNVSIVAAAASGYVFGQFASLAAAAWCACALVYIFCVEGVFALGCVFLVWFLACGWFLDFGGHVLGLRIENLCCVASTQHSRFGPLTGAEKQDGGRTGAGVCSLLAAAHASGDVFPSVDVVVHDSEIHREDRPNTAGCLSAGIGDWASGRVDVPGSVDHELRAMRHRSEASEAAESSSTPDMIQAMVISLSGKTVMIDADPEAPVLLLVEDVAKVLGLPRSCFYLTVGSRVLREGMSLSAEGVGSNSVVRVCARMRGGMQPVNGGFGGGGFVGGGDFGQWTCTNPQCRANRCWPTKSKCFRCGAPKGYGLTQDPGRPPYPPPGWQPREQHHPGRPVQASPGIAPTMSKKAVKAARREAAATATSGFPPPVPLTKVQALELLKGDLDGELFLELQTRLAQPKVVPPKKKEDALLRKRIEKDKAKNQQAKLEQRVYNLRNDLALAESQAEENRQRVLVLQSEWQALYDQAGEVSDDKVEDPCSEGNPESDGMEATDEEKIPLGDSDGFLTVLSRHRDQEDTLNPLPPPQASSDMMDRVKPVQLCHHLLDNVPLEFEGTVQDLANTLLRAIADKTHERGGEAAGRAFVQRYSPQG